MSGLSIGDAPWIDAIVMPTANRNGGIDPRQNHGAVRAPGALEDLSGHF